MPNRLIEETSPYLRQHANNPVDWYPWGDEALNRARTENKPILLSIGYAACHWCHVMERESFEDEQTAAQMNENFVCIKVDREERPDLDTIYMQATQIMSGHGGWPMTVFLTPEGVPFYAGTYFPPDNRHGMPSFRQVLSGMAEAWRKRPDDVGQNAAKMKEALQKMAEVGGADGDLNLSIVDGAARKVAARFDEREGGFGHAPKFPQPMTMALLLRHYNRTRDPQSRHMVELTLRKMARGGIYDQLGGGFARYSTDERWLVPHFEKMLYDNALLASLYLETWQLSKEDLYRTICSETIEYVLRDMTDPLGGFYATEDADSEGVEGRFYVWTPDEIKAILRDDRQAEIVCQYWDVTPHGNFEHGASILNVPLDADVVAVKLGIKIPELIAAISDAKVKLFAARAMRIRPMRDEKIIAFWNGLMLDTLARAAMAFERHDWHEAAKKAAAFLVRHLWVNGHMLRVYKDGQAKLNGYLEDYAAVANALLSLYEVTGELNWFKHAREIIDRMIELFEDPVDGGFFFTSSDHETLITRFKDPYDNATPSGTSLATTALLRIGALTGHRPYSEKAERVLHQMREYMIQAPSGFGQLLCALDFYLQTPYEIAIVTDSAAQGEGMRNTIFTEFIPNKVVASRAAEDTASAEAVPLLAGKMPVDHDPTVYVCKNFTCKAPVTGAASLRKELGLE
jgi:uncharacterized protein YyaL (SSP411 family)